MVDISSIQILLIFENSQISLKQPVASRLNGNLNVHILIAIILFFLAKRSVPGIYNLGLRPS